MVKTKPAPRKAVAKKTAKESGKTSKAQSIRDTAKELGKKARPKDIIAALANKGITVSSPQVSMTLKAAGLKKGKRKVGAVSVTKASGNGQALNLDDLIKVKELAAKFGGTEKLKEAVTALARLGIG